MIAVDGTKLPGNASRNANVDYERLARAILEEARAVDAVEDGLYGDARGDELPERLRTGEVAARGCARPSAGSSNSARRRRARFRGTAASG